MSSPFFFFFLGKLWKRTYPCSETKLSRFQHLSEVSECCDKGQRIILDTIINHSKIYSSLLKALLFLCTYKLSGAQIKLNSLAKLT